MHCMYACRVRQWTRSQLALAALFQMHRGDEKGVVNETANAKASGSFQPRRQVAKGHHKSNGRTVRVGIHVFAVQKERQTGRGQHQANEPGKALGLGGFPVRFRVQHGSNDGGKRAEGRHGRQTNRGADNKLKGDNGEEGLDKVGFAPKEHVDERDPSDNVQETRANANDIFVHVHVVWLVGVGVVSKLPPLAVLAANDETVHHGHGFVLDGGCCCCGVLLIGCCPRKVLGLQICFNGVTRIGNDNGFRLCKFSILENHKGWDGGQSKEVAHGLGALETVRHDIDARLLVDTGLKGCGVAIVAHKDDFAAFLSLQRAGHLDDRGSQGAAAVVSKN